MRFTAWNACFSLFSCCPMTFPAHHLVFHGILHLKTYELQNSLNTVKKPNSETNIWSIECESKTGLTKRKKKKCYKWYVNITLWGYIYSTNILDGDLPIYLHRKPLYCHPTHLYQSADLSSVGLHYREMRPVATVALLKTVGTLTQYTLLLIHWYIKVWFDSLSSLPPWKALQMTHYDSKASCRVNHSQISQVGGDYWPLRNPYDLVSQIMWEINWLIIH